MEELGGEESEEHDAELSAMAWEVAVRGKSGREIGTLHENWATALQSRDVFDKAQEHLDQALDAWTGYNEPALVARTWCLKGSCSAAASDFTVAASSFKRAQQLAEEAGDVQLALCVMLNRAICEIRVGDPTAAAACSRRAFVKAEAEHEPEMILVAHCVSYQMAGNFLAACNEHEAAARLVADGGVSPPEPALALAMDTNLGISILRSGRPGRATAPFDRALATARDKLGGEPPLTLARCLFHAGEARRQAGEFATARVLLEDVAALVDREGAAVLGVDTSERSKWGSLAMEVANSRGLCAIAEGAQRFNAERTSSLAGDEPTKARPDTTALLPEAAPSGGDSSSSTDRASATSEESGVQSAGVGGGVGGDGDVSRGAPPRGRSRQAETTAERAAKIIAAGGKVGGGVGAHPVQKTYNAVLEGLVWSLAGRGDTDGALAVKRAEKGLESMLQRRRRSSTVKEPANANPAPSSGSTSEALGESSFAGSESDGQMLTLQLGVLSSQGLMERGGLGLGAGCCTSVSVVRGTGGGAKTGKAKQSATGALAAVAVARAAAKAAAAGWAGAGQLAKKQLASAAQATTESARQLSVAHAHAGAINLMTGDLVEAEGRFECQLEEAQKAGDAILEALAERNLADAREADDDLPGALRHLRRCWNLAQRGRNSALEVDTCRRLCTVYSEIAAAASPRRGVVPVEGATAAIAAAGGVSEAGGGVSPAVMGERSDEREEEEEEEEGGGGGGEDDTEAPVLEETEIEEREDNDLAFLRATAAERALLFADRYEAGVSGLEWPVSADIAAGGGSEPGGGASSEGGDGDSSSVSSGGGSGGDGGGDFAHGLANAEAREAGEIRLA